MSIPVSVKLIFLGFLAYCLGSLSSAVIISKLFRLPDPRTQGSGNPGATNILRLSGKKFAVVVLLCDLAKGLIPVLLGRLFSLPLNEIGMIGFCAIMGHIFPVFFQFKGGKGVATSAGVLIGLSPVIGGLVLLTWLTIALIFRYSSLAAMMAAISAPFYGYMLTRSASFTGLLALISLVILIKHYANMKKLLNGTESKIGKSN